MLYVGIFHFILDHEADDLIMILVFAVLLFFFGRTVIKLIKNGKYEYPVIEKYIDVRKIKEEIAKGEFKEIDCLKGFLISKYCSVNGDWLCVKNNILFLPAIVLFWTSHYFNSFAQITAPELHFIYCTGDEVIITLHKFGIDRKDAKQFRKFMLQSDILVPKGVIFYEEIKKIKATLKEKYSEENINLLEVKNVRESYVKRVEPFIKKLTLEDLEVKSNGVSHDSSYHVTSTAKNNEDQIIHSRDDKSTKRSNMIRRREDKAEKRGKILFIIIGVSSLAGYIFCAYCGITNTNQWMMQLNNNSGSHRAPNWYHIGNACSVMFSASTLFLIPWEKIHNEKASRAFYVLHFAIPMAIMTALLLFVSNK